MNNLKRRNLSKTYTLFCALALLLCACKEIPEHCGNYVLRNPFTGQCEPESGPNATEKRTVTWNTNGGVPAIPQTTVDYGGSVTAPTTAIKKADSGFGGWYTNSALTIQAKFPIVVTENKTLYAKWTPPSAGGTTYLLTVNYNVNSGNTFIVNNEEHTEPVSVTVDGGKPIEISVTDDFPEYTFEKWVVSEGGAVIGNAMAKATTVTLNADATITANFTQNSTDGGNYDYNLSCGNRPCKTVVIGGKTWMAENLNYKTADGSGSWCYQNSTDSCTKYGRLYDWKTAMAGATSSNLNPSGVQGVCPSGWHLPSRKEWDELSDLAATGQKMVTWTSGSDTGYLWPGAGNNLKSKSGWYNNGNGIDKFGFSALPGGCRLFNGLFDYAGEYGHWWTTTEDNSGNAYARYMDYMDYDYDYVSESNFGKDNALSVRCVQTPLPTDSTFVDERDGKVYKKVTIGGKTWMAGNLNYKTADDTGSWCYDNSTDSCAKYGRLYNWSTAMAGKSGSNANPSGVQGVCPNGWHLPSSAEWGNLVTAATVDGYLAGYNLKSQSGWYNNGNGSDKFGFSALPGGNRSSDGSFGKVGSSGYWWTATENGGSYANYRYTHGDLKSDVDEYHDVKSFGYSVRCVQQD